MSDPTVVEQFREMVVERLDSPDLTISEPAQGDGPMAVTVSHHGTQEPIEEIAASYPQIRIDEWTMRTDSYTVSGEEMLVTEADIIITDPVATVAGGGSSKPAESGTEETTTTEAGGPHESTMAGEATLSDESDTERVGVGAEAEENEADTTLNEPAMRVGVERDGNGKEYHLEAADEHGAYACQPHSGTVLDEVSNKWDNIFDMLQDERLCERCGQALVISRNLPPGKVPQPYREVANRG